MLVGVGLPPTPALSAGSGGGTVVPGAEWTVDTPASHGMDVATLDGARVYAMADGRNTQGVVVVHEDAIVAEWYAPGRDATSPAASWSMAKSFTSALIGIAIGEGLIPSIDVPMSTYYPSWVGTPREAITLRHVLHMESGLQWDEDYSPGSLATSDIIQMLTYNPDQLAYAAARPFEVAPGTRWNYSSGDTMLLSGVLEQATGMPAGEYARTKMLDPIGIGALDWWQDAAGHSLTYCCVDTTSRDFARFGLLYLHDGLWGSKQVVPASWVQDSITDTAANSSGYGYQWWLQMGGSGAIPPYFSARGHDGQYIYVIPSLDLVVVRNGLYDKSACPPIADPSLLEYYPPQGLVPDHGTVGPETGWSDTDFLTPIVESLIGGGAARAAIDGDAAAGGLAAQEGGGASHNGCRNVAPPTTTSTTVASASPTTTVPPAAQPIVATPTFTG